MRFCVRAGAPRARRTRITPTTIDKIAGQKVKKNSNPGPIGLGFGSGQRPIAAATMMKSSGPAPTTRSPIPARTHQDCRYAGASPGIGIQPLVAATGSQRTSVVTEFAMKHSACAS